MIKYCMHNFEVKRNTAQDALQPFLYQLEGEILAIVPNISPTFQLMGATSRLDFLLIVENAGKWAKSSSYAPILALLGRSWQEDSPASLREGLRPGDYDRSRCAAYVSRQCCIR
jgi:hypothetical protein